MVDDALLLTASITCLTRGCWVAMVASKSASRDTKNSTTAMRGRIEGGDMVMTTAERFV